MESSVTNLPIPGGWKRQVVCVEGRSFVLTLPADPDRLLEQLPEDEDSSGTAPPVYWAALWSAALPTAAAVLRAAWSPGLPALELGCGIGLLGLAALAAGLNVTFSDAIATAVQLAEENARQNGFATTGSFCFDWREPPSAQFPVVLASDVLYDRGDHPAIVDLLARCLSHDGVCWIGDPGRAHVEQFVAHAARAGFVVRLFDADDQPMNAPHAGAYQRCLLYTSPSPRDRQKSRMPSSA
jgi:predicted nicotinamide N-methyase